MVSDIDWGSLQEKWMNKWSEEKIFESDPDEREKYFITVAYPYPNSPQHIGHGRTYTLADAHARYMRMRGYNVLFPMGFHYTGTPILAMSRRVAENDLELIKTFVDIYKVPEDVIKKFTEPVNIARYFHEEIKQGMREIGYSIDWRREFTTIDPLYNKFISWQFRKLAKKGLVVQGSHPVGWCPKDNNPVSQHDTLGDIEPEFNEYTLIKFDLKNIKIPTATLRPETIFGVTNLWINPDSDYVRINIDNEEWIVSQKCANKLAYLNRNINVIEEVKGRSLVGKEVKVPLIERSVVILPARFVDPSNGTGIVMSVPAHAPYDYQALEDLRNNRIPMEFNIDVNGIKPIVIITSERYKEIPARSVILERKIKSQEDPALEEATTDLYAYEFYKGIMMENTPYAGMSVSKARERVKEDLLHAKLADTMLELTKPVKCRCGTECVVKILNDQWFLDYSNKEWKAKAHRCIGKLKFVPEDIRQEFEYTIDWLKERACARRSGLGTKLPWAQDWVIESLSDSVIYMAYYILAKYVKDLDPDKINDEFFDYVFLGSHDPNEVSERCGISKELLQNIKDEFEYYYPVDSRHSGRDLVPNHLTFFIFNHVAIFEEEKWPKKIVVNGSVLMEGKKMSKSMGNIVPLRSAIKEYGADAIRISILIAAELLQDADFTFDALRGVKERLEKMYSIAAQLKNIDVVLKLELEDRWLLSTLQHIIESVTIAMDRLKIREALHNIIYNMDQYLQWYTKRTEAKNRSNAAVIARVIDARVRMLAPFAPYISEEIWSLLGNKESISKAEWPKVDPSLIDYRADEAEALIANTLADIQNIVRVAKIKPRKIYIYTASRWKKKLYDKILKIILDNKTNFGEVMKIIVNDAEMEMAKKMPEMVKKIIEDILSDSIEARKRKSEINLELNEVDIFEDGKSLLAKELEAEVIVYDEDDSNKVDPKGRAKTSRPFKPALYIE